MANEKNDVTLTIELLMKQRAQGHEQNAEDPETERRVSDRKPRSISDRRSNFAPNQTDHSRRLAIKDRRQTKFGRRLRDLTVRSKLLKP